MAVALGISSSSSQTVDNSQSESRAGTVGDLSSNNRLFFGDYSETGLVGDNLFNVIDSIKSAAIANYDSTVSALQANTSKAIDATGQAYAESKSELRNALDGLKPIALYAAIGMALFYALKKR